MKHFQYGIAALLAFAIGSASATVVTANAVADFAATQGNNGWSYGFAFGTSSYRTSDFQLFAYQTNINGYAGLNGWTSNSQPDAMITPIQEQDYLHIHPGDNAWSVLRYNITTAGDLNTYFKFGRLNPHPSGSVNARVFMNGLQVWSANDIRTDQSFSGIWTAKVNVGDKLDFIIDPNGPAGSDGSSLSANVTIAPVPEPETYALVGMGLLGLFAVRRKVKRI